MSLQRQILCFPIFEVPDQTNVLKWNYCDCGDLILHSILRNLRLKGTQYLNDILNNLIYWWLIDSPHWLLLPFYSKILGMWWGPTNGNMSFYESRSSGGDTSLGTLKGSGHTQTLPAVIEFI